MTPIPGHAWLSTHTGAACVLARGDGFFDLIITGRDPSNRSVFGRATLDCTNARVIDIDPQPFFGHGALGCFDENGTSYPSFIQHDGRLFMYYTGWRPCVLTPFINQIGLAISKSLQHPFVRHSQAPILTLSNEEPFGHGSCCVMREKDGWHMWYTAFSAWNKPSADAKATHDYHIRYASSIDGLSWQQEGIVCIDYANTNEYAICRPTVIRTKDGYFMWFCSRGKDYQIGAAYSTDAKKWKRIDCLFDSHAPWERSRSYPHVFSYNKSLYMLYSGADYGHEGLGLAVCPHFYS